MTGFEDIIYRSWEITDVIDILFGDDPGNNNNNNNPSGGGGGGCFLSAVSGM